jgi:hypothetical protein
LECYRQEEHSEREGSEWLIWALCLLLLTGNTLFGTLYLGPVSLCRPYLGRSELLLQGLSTCARVAFCCQHDVDMCKFPFLSVCSCTKHPLLHQFQRLSRIDRDGEAFSWEDL